MASVARYCCCGECDCDIGVTCGQCNDCTPAEYTVVISGISLCTSCFNVNGLGVEAKLAWAAGDVANASHTLTQVSGLPCRWEKTYTNALSIEVYDTESCPGGTPDVSSTYDVIVRLIMNGSTWRLLVLTDENPSVYFDYTLFDDQQASDSNASGNLCATISATFTSDLTTCGSQTLSSADTTGGTGGTATITCVSTA